MSSPLAMDDVPETYAEPEGPGRAIVGTGFSWAAILLGPFWLFKRGLYPWGVALLGVTWLTTWKIWVPATIALGFGGHHLHRWTLERRGWVPLEHGAAEPVSDITHTRCMHCREIVRRDASLCKHCQSPLVPQFLGRRQPTDGAADDRHGAPR